MFILQVKCVAIWLRARRGDLKFLDISKFWKRRSAWKRHNPNQGWPNLYWRFFQWSVITLWRIFFRVSFGERKVSVWCNFLYKGYQINLNFIQNPSYFSQVALQGYNKHEQFFSSMIETQLQIFRGISEDRQMRPICFCPFLIRKE